TDFVLSLQDGVEVRGVGVLLDQLLVLLKRLVVIADGAEAFRLAEPRILRRGRQRPAAADASIRVDRVTVLFLGMQILRDLQLFGRVCAGGNALVLPAPAFALAPDQGRRAFD